jgi:hypothetical protein
LPSALLAPIGATEYVTVPFPDPEAPLVIVTQSALDVAVQVHPLVAVTATLPVPPVEDTTVLVGDIE